MAHFADNQPPAKRPRLSHADPEDETPGEARDDVPEDFDLPAARAQNDSKLKSLFEGIFAKYSHDFTDVGDEIDLESGKIVVDNGHLLGMQEEGASGGNARSWLFQAGLDDENPDTDHGDDMEVEQDTESVASVPNENSPDVSNLQTAPPVTLSEPPAHEYDSLDFVFTFKASGAAGSSPMTKTQHVSRPTNPPSSKTIDPIATSKPQDPIWAVPELPQSFSTPTTETRKINAVVTPSARSPSPPGSGSIWAVKGPGRPRTEAKPKATPRRRKLATKRKYHSSPVARDWSFAEVPDGNESDDPLQDYEPLPTPSKVRIIRGQYKVPTKGDGPSAQELTPSKDRINHETQQQPQMGNDTQVPQSSRLSPTESPANDGPVIEADSAGHPEKVNHIPQDNAPEMGVQHIAPPEIASTVNNGDPHGEDEARNQEDSPLQPNPDDEGIVEPGVIASTEDEETAADDNIDAQQPAPDVQSQLNMAPQSILRPESTPTHRTKVPATEPPQNTPSRRRIIEPDEAKLIMRVMYQENGKASDVVKLMPTLDYHAVWHWYFTHWTQRLTNPPRLSAPWSHSELAIFTRLTNQSGLTWAEIQREFSGRSRPEVEFELLRSFVDPQPSTKHPGKQPDDPANDSAHDSSQDVWMQAEEMKSESDAEGSLPSVNPEYHDARGESVSSISAEPLDQSIQGHSFVSNTLKNLFLR
ncbi:unnamed protein product [Penicillium olsonii]|uniref:Myb-like domain-containing protein n=1 Tax=Penicillium olsonii TaxID=99116 RepID=A0A9W4HXP6_PENOL|nr:unnamed protein product [Penicillium olsonii]CAG8237404.1 unnamed protein product [Penicillium olsonii]